jgi:hypothetical protein
MNSSSSLMYSLQTASFIISGTGISSYSGRFLPISFNDKNAEDSIRKREYTSGETPGNCRSRILRFAERRLEL